MLTAAQAMELLQIRSPKTLRKIIKSGELKASKVGEGKWGGSYRIDEKDLADYIERQTVQPEAVNQ
jgi:excisionase family DNA binding protein